MVRFPCAVSVRLWVSLGSLRGTLLSQVAPLAQGGDVSQASAVNMVAAQVQDDAPGYPTRCVLDAVERNDCGVFQRKAVALGEAPVGKAGIAFNYRVRDLGRPVGLWGPCRWFDPPGTGNILGADMAIGSVPPAFFFGKKRLPVGHLLDDDWFMPVRAAGYERVLGVPSILAMVTGMRV